MLTGLVDGGKQLVAPVVAGQMLRQGERCTTSAAPSSPPRHSYEYSLLITAEAPEVKNGIWNSASTLPKPAHFSYSYVIPASLCIPSHYTWQGTDLLAKPDTWNNANKCHDLVMPDVYYICCVKDIIVSTPADRVQATVQSDFLEYEHNTIVLSCQ